VASCVTTTHRTSSTGANDAERSVSAPRRRLRTPTLRKGRGDVDKPSMERAIRALPETSEDEDESELRVDVDFF
jgi:hypothetical protein